MFTPHVFPCAAWRINHALQPRPVTLQGRYAPAAYAADQTLANLVRSTGMLLADDGFLYHPSELYISEFVAQQEIASRLAACSLYRDDMATRQPSLHKLVECEVPMGAGGAV